MLDNDDGRFDGDRCNSEDLFKPPNKDIFVQLGLSLLLGTSAFITFCVRHRIQLQETELLLNLAVVLTSQIGSAPKMALPICCAQTTTRCQGWAASPSRYLLRLDAKII